MLFTTVCTHFILTTEKQQNATDDGSEDRQIIVLRSIDSDG